MYLVTCPSCGHGEKSPFARVGAATICAGCGKVMQLRKEDIKRAFRLRTDLDDEIFKVAVVQHSAPEEIAKAPEQVDPSIIEVHEQVTDEGEHVEDHHDASALAAIAERRAENERRAESARRKRSAPAAAHTLSGAELAQHLARARSRRTMMVIVGLGGLIAAFVVVIIMAMSGNGKPEQPADPEKDKSIAMDDPTKNQSPTKDASDPTKDGTTPKSDPTKDQSKDAGKSDPPKPPPMVRVKAYPMGIDKWQSVDEPFRVIPQGNTVAVLNQSNEALPDGGRLFRAEVGCKRTGASALAIVNLINDEDRVFARFERPLALLDSSKRRVLELAIPSEYSKSIATLYCAVQPLGAEQVTPRMLDDTLAEVLTPGETAVLKLSGLNSSSYVLTETVFVLQAVDDAGRVERQWRMKYPHPLDAKTWVRFEAEVLLEGGAMPKWRVQAAGLPTGDVVQEPAKDGTPPQTPVNPPDERPRKDPPAIRPGRGLFDF